MIRVHVICEGQTEEMFVKEVLSDLFISKGIDLRPSLIGKPGQKGGNFKFKRLLTDLRIRLLNDTDSYSTTFFDFYGLPEKFPGKAAAQQKQYIRDKSRCLLKALTERLTQDLGEEAMSRFIPYVQMYEFEGLLFSDPGAFAKGIYQDGLKRNFKNIRNSFASPEEINDSKDTAPSKRIQKLYPGYDKPIHGSLAAIEIGLNTIRRECPLFDGWINRIASLAAEGDI